MDNIKPVPKRSCEECGKALFSTSICEACCQHDDFDHDMCIDCGYERDPGDRIDWAMDRLEGR